MKQFIKTHVDATPIVDNVFAVVALAQEAKAKYGASKVIDATIGSLNDEAGSLVAFDSVFNHYNEIDNKAKAKYASSFSGNADYKKQVYEWVKQDAQLDLAHKVIATPGGSGAVSTTINDILDSGDTLVMPEIAWGSYKLMATMSNIKTETYSLFDGDAFHISDFKRVCHEVMDREGKVLAIINDPCHNPTGYSLTQQEWKEVIQVLNELSEQGPVVLMNDIAYIDFSYDIAMSRKYLETFNEIKDNVMIVVAFSCSKTLTSYGLRCGAALLLAQDEASVRQVEIVMEKSARALWSNIPNAAMDNFVYTTTIGYDAFDKEKAYYVDLLKTRSTIFTTEAKEVGLTHYPYREGFFVTLDIEDKEILNAYHEALMKEHIFTVKVNKGIRVGLCSLNIEKTKGLAKRMKDILGTI